MIHIDPIILIQSAIVIELNCGGVTIDVAGERELDSSVAISLVNECANAGMVITLN